MTGPYAAAAQMYWRAGWANPIPVVGKSHPPTGYTGYDGATVTWPDLQAWLNGPEAGQNVALRLPGDVVGIDVDAYDGKSGDESLAAAVAELGPLPATAWSTSRAPFQPSGIRFYRVPPSASLRGAEKRFTARFGDHVDIIRRDHRYAVVWPSVHPDTGTTYTWYGPDGEQLEAPPKPTTLAELPPAWVAFLTEPDPAVAASGPASAGTTAEPSPWDLPRVFTQAQAEEFVRPAFERLRSAPNGTINNRLNEAAVTIGHFVPAFWPAEVATRWLLDALTDTVYDGRTWRAETTIASGLNARTWRAERGADEPDGADSGELGQSRRVDLGPWLDGSWKPPQPSHGAFRDDGRALLYPGRWHTLVGPNESGKTWLELVHAREELLNHGRTVVMVHFEESLPGGTVARLLSMGLAADLIRDRFVWLACDRQWSSGDLAAELASVEGEIGLVILDGINAACTSHGHDPKDAPTVGWYRSMFVAPAARLGAAVLSAGHPVKARDRQDERHGFGSTAWLDECDGVAFRLTPSTHPIRKGVSGAANLFVVKDRYGEVSALTSEERDGWRYVGSVVVDDADERTAVRIVAARSDAAAAVIHDPIDALGEAIVRALGDHGGAYPSNRRLAEWLRGSVKYDDRDLAPALDRLERNGRIERDEEPPPGTRRPWPGRLVTAVNHDQDETDE